MSEFKRGLSDDFVKLLSREAENRSWWADVLDDAELFIGVRDDCLNVYWRGASLFQIEHGESGVSVTTHPKYLLDPDLSDQVLLTQGKFDISWLAEHGFMSLYEGPRSLEKLKKAAELFSKPEKTGCHDVVLNNSHIIDCEIAFPCNTAVEKGAIRVDLLSLEPNGQLVFWEAKHFNNDDLRAEDDKRPNVCKQIQAYKDYLSVPQHRSSIEKSYSRVANNLIAIKEMGWKRQLSPLINTAAEKNLLLSVGAEPKVGLVIFGFDRAQRKDLEWKHGHLAKLKKEIDLVAAAGEAKNIKLKL